MGERRDVKRILLVLGTSAGGVGRHVRMLAEGFAQRGHRVVVAGPPSTEETFRFSAAGAVFAPVAIAERPRPASDLRAAATLRRLARGGQGPHAVHAHGLRAGALAGLALTGTATPLVVTLHNALTAGGATGAVYGVLERIVAARAARILVVSPDLGERMTALRARHVEPAVVPAPPLRPPARPVAEVRAELGAEPGRPVLLTIARLAQQKGLEMLLDVAAGLAGPDAPLFAVAGDGPLRARLQDRIDAEGLPVRLLGDRGDVPDLLAAARLLVAPSRWEGQPLNVQEALRAGRPVIATAVGGVPAMVGDAGLLVPYGDAAGMRAAIGRVLGDPELAGNLERAATRRGSELPGEEEAVTAALAAYPVAATPGDDRP
ncbi:glycosyl transferase [Microtetraspora sp. NBRC 13810]|uniref:glycosyltransferase n=1 Tax=Microtetraspora sp. NBRC 13810 TaxID=3030990 RepID=UPI0024A12D8C|nr:glycosyltransferase [Microtetraspora sp. NBRC 13810]GLW08371.1 glycosyl transferase [Microtetraspora sp. NBRC 13810]